MKVNSHSLVKFSLHSSVLITHTTEEDGVCRFRGTTPDRVVTILHKQKFLRIPSKRGNLVTSNISNKVQIIKEGKLISILISFCCNVDGFDRLFIRLFLCKVS